MMVGTLPPYGKKKTGEKMTKNPTDLKKKGTIIVEY